MESTQSNRSSDSEDILDYKVNVSVANSGVTPDSKYNQLMQKAARLGGKHLQEFSTFCADMQSSLTQMLEYVDVDKIEPKHNKITDEYGYFFSALVGTEKWSFSIIATPVSNATNAFVAMENGDEMIPQVQVTTHMSHGPTTLYSASIWTSIIGGIVTIPLTMGAIWAKATLKALEKGARIAVESGATMQGIMAEGSKAMQEGVEAEIKTVVKAAGKKARILYKASTIADSVILALVIASIVISIIAKTTIWQLTILNKTISNLIWKEDLKNGYLSDAPFDSVTGKYNHELPRIEVKTLGEGWGEDIFFNYVKLGFSHEKALTGITGSMTFKMVKAPNPEVQNSEEEPPVYDVSFNLPYDGNTKLEISINGVSGVSTKSETGELTWELIDKPNNLKFTYSLSEKESGKYSHPTINNGKPGNNFLSVVEIENIEQKELS